MGRVRHGLLVPTLIGALLGGTLPGCSADAGPVERASRARSAQDGEAIPPGSVYERDVVFLGKEGDSLVAVPFSFSARVEPGAVTRSVSAVLLRDGEWDPFHASDWDAPASRTPWRILPHGPIGLLMGLDDALEGVVFEQGRRQMEVRLGAAPETWSGPRGETVSLQDGLLTISGSRMDGMVLELARTWRAPEHPVGDWFFLMSGDSLGVVLLDTSMGGPEPRYRGWARTFRGDVLWTDIQVERTESRPFEPARRDVPSRWLVHSAGPPGGEDNPELAAELTVVSSHLSAGEGNGPLLPVDGLLRVAGELRIEGRVAQVAGVVRHRQP